jgi:hypothetical protein
MVAGSCLGKKDGILAKTKLALRPYAIVSRRERHQGSAMNGPAGIAGPPLTPLPPRKKLGSHKTQPSRKRVELCAQKRLKSKEKDSKKPLTKPASSEMYG